MIMNFNEDDIREACSDIRKLIADKLSEDFSAYNIEYRQEYDDAIKQLNTIIADNDDSYFENICDLVLEGYDTDFADYLEENYIADILADEAQEHIEYLNENCEFDSYEDYSDEDDY